MVARKGVPEEAEKEENNKPNDYRPNHSEG